MTIVDADGRLTLGATTWHVRAGFEFEERDGAGCAALVEGNTLLLFHADTHIEAVTLADIEGLEAVPRGSTAIAVHHAGRRLVLKGDARGVSALQQAAGGSHRRAPAGAWVWAEPADD